ncbi:MAG: DUF4159 domain-containing protein [Chloroflexi bacterium]|nr:DUF4159 domain-containing protein [Chloroflexota bacterium]
MKKNVAFDTFPKKHLAPYDGMSITAEVWAQAHEEHRTANQAHNINLHGSGIITGLEVVANDPADQYVFISPGAAIDSAGNVIVIDEPVAYDFGSSSEGTLFLLLAHGEREVGGAKKTPKYQQYEFVITARPTLPKRPTVELARIHINDTGKAIKNADDATRPAAEMLDLRFRNELNPQDKKIVRVLVLGLGSTMDDVLDGWSALAKAAPQLSDYKLIVDAAKADAPLSGLNNYDLVYLGMSGAFLPKAATTKAITTYLEKGKSLFVEALDDGAKDSSQAFLKKLKQTPKKLAKNTTLLNTPFLFNAPPDGFAGSHVEKASKALFSTAAYSLGWSGRVKSGSLSRADIRSAHEWGINLIYDCLDNE